MEERMTTESASGAAEPTAAERRATIRKGMMVAFENAVREHFQNHPSTWEVKKAADRHWNIIDGRGVRRDFTHHRTKKAATEDLASGSHHRQWSEDTRWYLGSSRDTRLRALADDEKTIVHQVLSELPPVQWTEEDGTHCQLTQDDAGKFSLVTTPPNTPRGDQ